MEPRLPTIRRTLATRGIAFAALAALFVLAALTVQLGRWFEPAPVADTEPADALALSIDRALQRETQPGPGVAIRPLAAATAPQDTAALAGAICAALADRLARLPSLRVVPCSSTAAAVAAELDDRRLARLLAVGFVLTGRLTQREGERVGVQLVLHEVGAAREAWRIDEEITSGELQALPARVAAATAAALGQPAATTAEAAIAPQQYARFLLAQQLANRVSADDRRRAIALLDELLAAEPNHVPSLYLRQTLRGAMLGNLGEKGVAELNVARAANVEAGLALARRLVAADPLDSRGQFLLLADEMERRQWPQGFDRLDAMLQRHPRLPGLMRTAARLHLHAGYLARARELALGAAQLNALDAQALEILAAVAGIEGDDARLRELMAIARQLGHDLLGRLEVFEASRRADWNGVERALSAYVAWGGRWPADWVPAYVRGLANPAERAAAVRLLDGHDSATRQHFASYMIDYALLGETPRALASVRHHAANLPPASWMQFLWWPELAAVRQQPGFAEAMRDLGAVALWEHRGAPELCRRDAAGTWACR
jgi:TolB-like protein